MNTNVATVAATVTNHVTHFVIVTNQQNNLPRQHHGLFHLQGHHSLHHLSTDVSHLPTVLVINTITKFARMIAKHNSIPFS